MGLLTGLFRAARKRLMTTDNDMGAFREGLNALVEQKDSMDDAAIAAKVDELKTICADLPEGDEKSKLIRFLEDFKAVKEQDAAVAKEAASSVADLFEKLDTEAMKDAPEMGAEVATEENSEVEEPAAEEITEEAAAEESEEKEVGDDDPDPTYSLEEIYQFIKKRMAEDAAEGAEEPATEETEEELEEKEVTQDHARIAVTMNNSTVSGGLRELFETAKKGGIR